MKNFGELQKECLSTSASLCVESTAWRHERVYCSCEQQRSAGSSASSASLFIQPASSYNTSECV